MTDGRTDRVKHDIGSFYCRKVRMRLNGIPIFQGQQDIGRLPSLNCCSLNIVNAVDDRNLVGNVPEHDFIVQDDDEFVRQNIELFKSILS